MIKSFLTGGAELPRERVKDLLLDDHLECGCLGSVGGEGEGAEDDDEDARFQRQLFDFFLGLTLGRSFSSLISMLTWVFYSRYLRLLCPLPLIIGQILQKLSEDCSTRNHQVNNNQRIKTKSKNSITRNDL